VSFTPITVLIVDDEVSAPDLCSDVAIQAGFRVRTSATSEEALEILEQYPVDIVITDLKVPELGGLELLKRIRPGYPQIAVMVLTQYGTIETAVEAARLGAMDYVTKPFHVDELRAKLERLVRAIELDQENRVLREQLRSRPGFGGLIGISGRVQKEKRRSLAARRGATPANHRRARRAFTGDRPPPQQCLGEPARSRPLRLAHGYPPDLPSCLFPGVHEPVEAYWRTPWFQANRASPRNTAATTGTSGA